ncbi:MAG: hypothetical protein Q9N32_01630 [Gammaproteobacteria bacterium]|nr:hypothetical protein [Gammaproteobacteria bacterium]
MFTHMVITPVIRVSNHNNEWLLAIRTAISDKGRLKEEGKKLRNWVSQSYILEANVKDWLKALGF